MRDTVFLRRRHLPHWDVPGATYFITTCLDGSIPAQGLIDLRQYALQLKSRVKPAEMSLEEHENQLWKLKFARVDRWLDSEPACRHLAKPELAQTVVDSLLYFAGVRYDLFAFCVMPSHLHWLFRPRAEWVESIQDNTARSPRERIQHTLNLRTASECNRILGSKDAFWQHESYDHWVRDLDEFERIRAYIEANPVKAGLAHLPEEWTFSSAHFRTKWKIDPGRPLLIPAVV